VLGEGWRGGLSAAGTCGHRCDESPPRLFFCRPLLIFTFLGALKRKKGASAGGGGWGRVRKTQLQNSLPAKGARVDDTRLIFPAGATRADWLPRSFGDGDGWPWVADFLYGGAIFHLDARPLWPRAWRISSGSRAATLFC